ncbi:hypothetical protein CHUAL_007389 [Chamberlinius hualienensis]
MLRVSPLYKFKFEKRFLKDLTRKINVNIQKENLWDIEGEGRVPGSYVVSIEPLVGNDGNHFEGILIKVVQVPELEDEEEEDENRKIHFWGVLCRNLSKSASEVELSSKNMINMPIFLVKGNVPLANSIIKFFSKQFDCIIREFRISPLDLTWLATMWAAYPTDDSKIRRLILKYEYPEDFKNCRFITLTIDEESVLHLWKSVHDTKSDNFRNTEKEAFVKSLNAHHFNQFGIKLDRLTLIEVETSSININRIGKLKLFSKTTSNVLIQYFASLVDQANF